jgi:hypothetical protein
MNLEAPASSRRRLRGLDRVVLVAAVAMTPISPAVMETIMPADSHHDRDRRPSFAHPSAPLWMRWTAAPIPPVLAGGRGHLHHARLHFGVAAALASDGLLQRHLCTGEQDSISTPGPCDSAARSASCIAAPARDRD